MFTQDWFYRQRPYFEKHLLPLADVPLECLEIGSFEGASAIWVMDNLPQSRVTCIDPFEGILPYPGAGTDMAIVEKLFLENIKDYPNITVIKGYSGTELKKLPENHYDFIYIDGSHDANDCLEDMILSWRLLKQGGMMAVDDYWWHHFADPLKVPELAIETFIELWAGQYELLDLGWQAWLYKR